MEPHYGHYTLFTMLFAVSIEGRTPVRNCPKMCSCNYAIINTDSLEVNCEGAGLNEMPLALPPAQTYRLLFARNNITKLEFRHYLKDTDFLDLSYNRLSAIQNETVLMFDAQLRYLYLHGNELECLPTKIQNVDLSHVHEISLYSNPWDCACANLWMKKWVQHNLDIIQTRQLLCGQKTIEESYLAQKENAMDRRTVTSQTALDSKTVHYVHVLEKHALLAFIVVLLSMALIYSGIVLLYFYKLKALEEKKNSESSDTKALV